jgi:hypothetical protein
MTMMFGLQRGTSLAFGKCVFLLLTIRGNCFKDGVFGLLLV